ncbi:rubredoxin [Pseudomonas aeruginosa]
MRGLRLHLRRSPGPARRRHPAGTRWEDIPADQVCPDCGVGKIDFEMIEIA